MHFAPSTELRVSTISSRFVLPSHSLVFLLISLIALVFSVLILIISSSSFSFSPPLPRSSPLRCCRDLAEVSSQINLKSVREALIRQEDSIVFSLIERSRHPYNAPAYDQSYLKSPGSSLAELFVKEAEHLHAKAGRYENPEEVPFFPEDLPSPMLPSYNYPQVLYPAAASVNITKTIWNMYFNELLPLFTVKGDDGNYACTLASDLVCLQAISRRIHYGKFVAEVKFTDAPLDYSFAIQNKDKDALMRMLTFERVEEIVKLRVEKKAMIFGQQVTMEDKEEDKVDYKVCPSVVSRLYGDWIIPLTKHVEVEYLLRRLE